MPADQIHDSAGRSEAAPYTIEVISTEDGLSRLEADWNRFSEASSHPNAFMTYGWFRAWTRRLTADIGRERLQPFVLAIRHEDSIVGIAPLVRRVVSRFGFRVRKLEFPTIHADYNDLVLGADSANQSEAVIEFLARTSEQWDLADLRNLRDIGNSIAHIKAALARAGLSHRILPEGRRYPYFPINSPWPTMMKSKHLRFARRAFVGFTEKSSEGFRLRIVENPQSEPGLHEKLVAVEAQKFIGGKPTQPFLGEYRDVFRSLFDTLGPLGWITAVLVEREGQLVAYRLLYRCGKKLWDYQTAYDHGFSDLSPGTVAICAAIDYGYEHGFDEFDFLTGEEPYKLRWTPDFRRTYRLLIWNRRGISRVRKFFYYDVKTTIHRLLRKKADHGVLPLRAPL
jgi:CelD/BcsL family acetyltransferase involved in cellulose biosynthesis